MITIITEKEVDYYTNLNEDASSRNHAFFSMINSRLLSCDRLSNLLSGLLEINGANPEIWKIFKNSIRAVLKDEQGALQNLQRKTMAILELIQMSDLNGNLSIEYDNERRFC